MKNFAHAEIISWSLRGINVSHANVTRALEAAGLDPKYAREMCARNAFRRALRKMTDDRLIREVGEDKATLRFQFNSIITTDGEARYPYYATLELCKDTGKVRCLADRSGLVPDGGTELAARAEEMIGMEMGMRQTPDVTRLIRRICRDRADLFSPRDSGGFYLAIPENGDFLGQLDRFLDQLCNRRLDRFSLAGGQEASDTIVRTIQAGMEETVREYEETIAAYSDRTKDGVRRNSLERLATLRLKLDGYREELKDQYATLVSRVASLNENLAKALADPDEEPSTEDTPAVCA